MPYVFGIKYQLSSIETMPYVFGIKYQVSSIGTKSNRFLNLVSNITVQILILDTCVLILNTNYYSTVSKP